MKLIRQVWLHCAYGALLFGASACVSANDGPGLPGQVEAAGEASELTFEKKHHGKKHKKKKHYDECEPTSCESVELHVDSHKHREATEVLDRTIRVRIPESLPALYWGKAVEAELAFHHGDTRVVCAYHAKADEPGRLHRSLELERCDNGAEAGDTVTIDSASLSLECSGKFPFAKVHVELSEVEPCGEVVCDPDDLDDGDPCTIDTCDPDGGVTHTAAADGTSCDDGNVCNGEEACQAGKCENCGGTPPVIDDRNWCTTDSCDPVLGVRHVPVSAGTGCGDDGDVCTGKPSCNATGMCVPGTPLICDDGNQCNGTERCDPQCGCRPGVPLSCDDGNKCNGTEQCSAQDGCTAGTALDRDDGNECTIDACDRDSGVSHEPAPAETPCGSGPSEGICDGAGTCVRFS